MQGMVWGWFYFLSCPIIFGFDNVFVIILLLCSFCFSWFSLGLSRRSSSPGLLLTCAVRGLGRLSSAAGSVYCTDLVLTSFAGLPSLRSVSGWISPGASIFLRSLFFLSLVFLVT